MSLWPHFKKKLLDQLLTRMASGFLGLVVLGGPYLLRRVGPLRAYLEKPVELWKALSIFLAVGLVVAACVGRLLRSRKNLKLTVDKLQRTLNRYQRPVFFFDYLNLLWEIGGAFLQTFRSDEAPAVLESLITGPLCPGCQDRVEVHGLRAGGFIVRSPCPRCGHQHASDQLYADPADLKLRVYREAQRLARLGEFPSKELNP